MDRNIPSERLGEMGFSAYYNICSIDREYNLNLVQLQLITDLIDKHRFVYVPSHYINKPFNPNISVAQRQSYYISQIWDSFR